MSHSQQMQQLITDIQSKGVRLSSTEQEHVSRKGGAGPSDHQAIVIDGSTVMVPVHTQSANYSPYTLADNEVGEVTLKNEGIPIVDVTFARDPKFYQLKTSDGIPYSHIATLHSTDVLATTVLQTCIRYGGMNKTCKFCSIEQSLAAGRTIAYKRPSQLAEVAKAAVELDGVKHMVMTTGTPSTPDRGAKVLTESVSAVKAAVDLPIQVQCEPPNDHHWFQLLKEAGADALGMHIEVVSPRLRKSMMPSKSQITLDEYMKAFKAAVPIFGWGQVSTYILAGLGDTVDDILAVCDELIAIGVYPFVVPFVPIRGTPLEDHPAPSSELMVAILRPLGAKLAAANMSSAQVKAGCAKCGACSSLQKYENTNAKQLN
ncbi:MSMEG_0568 family radical SAM protein [Agaribacter marinus]|uniref:Radical SAM protein n=1 Tax=Agaribacter marinus TaxID=1431249 RepID=A0AA37SWQ8_9ALTE|nr:MSMEG_0568 family radical SAM protein [Agaribacter marinus]GLR69804.1 radical SAM protein [Agaribacter marinus]